MTTPLDAQMIRAASSRAIVRLTDGKLATLVSWGVQRKREDGTRGHPGMGNTIRLESPCGEHRWTAKKVDVVEIVE